VLFPQSGRAGVVARDAGIRLELFDPIAGEAAGVEAGKRELKKVRAINYLAPASGMPLVASRWLQKIRRSELNAAKTHWRNPDVDCAAAIGRPRWKKEKRLKTVCHALRQAQPLPTLISGSITERKNETPSNVNDPRSAIGRHWLSDPL